jgi:hypothetical protein
MCPRRNVAVYTAGSRRVKPLLRGAGGARRLAPGLLPALRPAPAESFRPRPGRRRAGKRLPRPKRGLYLALLEGIGRGGHRASAPWGSLRQCSAYAPRHRRDVREIHRAAFPLRGVHGYEEHIRLLHQPRSIRPSVSPAMRSPSLFMHVTWCPMCARQAPSRARRTQPLTPQRQDFSGPSPC